MAAVFFGALLVDALDEVCHVVEVAEFAAPCGLHEQQLAEASQKWSKRIVGTLAQDKRSSTRRGDIGDGALLLATASAIGVLDDRR